MRTAGQNVKGQSAHIHCKEIGRRELDLVVEGAPKGWGGEAQIIKSLILWGPRKNNQTKICEN